MKITNAQSNTSVAEIGEGVYRISTPVPPNPALPAGFSFNQILIADRDPLLFHSGPRKLFPLVREAVDSVIPASSLRYLGISHFEADECGALNDFLEVAPNAVPLCGGLAKVISIDDFAIREARGMKDLETLSLGTRTVQWFDAPHVPHGWECGYLFEQTTRTLLCGDLFTQPGSELPPLTEGDIFGPSEEMRGAMEYFSHAPNSAALLMRLAATDPTTLACMHGSAWRGDGRELLERLAAVFRC